MNPGRYFIPSRGIPFMYMPHNVPFSPMFRSTALNPNNTGLLGRLFRGIKTYNWKGLISGANKTLNVVNQTLPLIRQAKPMVNNVKSIVQLARAFGTETNSKKKSHQKIQHKSFNTQTKSEKKIDDSYPTFFI